jgi:hypothetical protein
MFKIGGGEFSKKKFEHKKNLRREGTENVMKILSHLFQLGPPLIQQFKGEGRIYWMGKTFEI